MVCVRNEKHRKRQESSDMRNNRCCLCRCPAVCKENYGLTVLRCKRCRRPRNFLQSDNRINHEVTPVHGVSIIHKLQAAGDFDKLVSCSSG